MTSHRRRNKLVIWEWSPADQHAKARVPPKRVMRNPERILALIAAGAGFLYFASVYLATGIFTGRRGDVVVTASEDPDRFSFAVGTVLAVGVGSLLAGFLMALRK